MIKKYLMLPVVAFAMVCTANAQKDMKTTNVSTTPNKMEMKGEVTNSDYERLLENYLDVSFRTYAYETLELNEEQIIAADPVYRRYMDRKNELLDRRNELLVDYQEEMMEDDRAEDEAEETAEFIEDYWEVNIDIQRLRKETFDRMEDAIGYENAFEFLMLEEALQNRAEQKEIVRYVPVLVNLDRPEVSRDRAVNEYNYWMKDNDINITGKTGLDHSYTYDGLMKLTSALEATVSSVDGDVSNFNSRINMIKSKAQDLRENKYGDTHADAARAAFTTVAEVMMDVAKLDGVVVSQSQLQAVKTAAEKINVNKLYLEQSQHAYNFFSAAQKAVNSMYTKSTVTTSTTQEKTNTTAADRKK